MFKTLKILQYLYFIDFLIVLFTVDKSKKVNPGKFHHKKKMIIVYHN